MESFLYFLFFCFKSPQPYMTLCRLELKYWIFAQYLTLIFPFSDVMLNDCLLTEYIIFACLFEQIYVRLILLYNA